MTDTKPSPIEVWITMGNIEITCRVVHEDESTKDIGVDALSMRGAQREITGYFIGQGYVPVGRWETQDVEGNEVMRRFKLA